MGLHEVSGAGLTRSQLPAGMRAASLTFRGNCHVPAFVVPAGSEFKFFNFCTRHKALQENSLRMEYCESHDTGFLLMLLY